MKFRVSNETLNIALNLIREGIHTPLKLAKAMKVTDRHVQRILAVGIEQNLIYRPSRGVYYTIDQKVRSFNEFVNRANSNSNNCVSGNREQNNTYKTEQDTHLISIFALEKEKDNKLLQEAEPDSISVTSHDQIGTLEDLTSRVLDMAGMWPCTNAEYKRCISIIRFSNWRCLTPEILPELVYEALTGFEEQEKSGRKISSKPNYFIGILRNKIHSYSAQQKREYMEGLRTGTDDIVVQQAHVTTATQRKPELTLAIPQTTKDAVEPMSSEPQIISEEWEDVKLAIEQLVQKEGSYEVPGQDIQNATIGLMKSGMKVSHALKGIQYMINEDKQGAWYFSMHIREPEVVRKSVESHYYGLLRSLKQKETVPNQSQPAKSAQSEKPTEKNQKDERYSAFYQLFPDA